MISEKRTNDLIEMVQKTKVLGLLPYNFTLWCNNNCDFCCLKPTNNKPMSFEKFKEIGDYEINWLKTNIKKLPKNTLLKHYFIGGEIGILPDKYFNYFYELFDSLYSITVHEPVNLDVTLFSNFILIKKQADRIFDLFDYISNKTKCVNLATSFDLTGRFNNPISLKLWKNNLKTIVNRETPLLIEVITRKSAINKYINEKNSDIVMTFDDLLDMDNDKKVSIVFNEYRPYNSKSMDELPTFDEVCCFYEEIKNRHGKNISSFIPYDITVESENDSFKSYCESTEFIPMFDKEESPCELIPHIFWPDDDVIKKDDILKNKLNGEFICLKHPEKVEDFFNTTYNCLICKYKSWCSKRHLRGCYQDHQFIWKNSNCIHKKLFEIVNDE